MFSLYKLEPVLVKVGASTQLYLENVILVGARKNMRVGALNKKDFVKQRLQALLSRCSNKNECFYVSIMYV